MVELLQLNRGWGTEKPWSVPYYFYLPDFTKVSKAMRPSATFNAALQAI